MKYCWGGKKTCRWCYWRDSHNRERHYCEALPTLQTVSIGCFCGDSMCRKNGMCRIVGGMKKPEQWCPQGWERNIAVSEVHLDNTCAMFRPLDLAHLDGSYHPLAVKRAAENIKVRRESAKSNTRLEP